MNIDMLEAKKSLKRTVHHVETIQEIRHLFIGGPHFTSFHQKAQHPDSHYIFTFRTPEYLQRLKVKSFGASLSSEPFHNKIKEAFCGLPGCTPIHDNILVCGKTPQEHETNLAFCLARIREKGLALCSSKRTFSATSVSWFGYIFGAAGMSADPTKIKDITQAGKPTTTEEVKSFCSLASTIQTRQPMSKLAESHSEMEFYFIHFGPIRSCGGSHLGPVIKDTAGFHSKWKRREKNWDVVVTLP